MFGHGLMIKIAMLCDHNVSASSVENNFETFTLLQMTTDNATKIGLST